MPAASCAASADRAEERAHACAGSLRPGDASVPLAVSTANGRAAAIASATLSGVEAAREDQRHAGPSCSRASSQSNVSPVPPRASADVGVEQVEVGVERAQAAHLRRRP